MTGAAAAADAAAPDDRLVGDPNAPASVACRHCGLPAPPGAAFCCNGCSAAFALVHELGLDAYYRRRAIDPEQRPLRPEEADDGAALMLSVNDDGGGVQSTALLVEGLHCAACVWLIEQVLARQPGVIEGRVNMTTRRLSLRWQAAETDAATLARAVRRLGYRLVPYDASCLSQAGAAEETELLRAMAVAGFAFGNVMLLSVSVWAGHAQGMGEATRTLLHWLSALVALPAIAYAGRPFFRSALGALRAGRTNMDVPISVGITLVSLMSLYETSRGAEHAYFDSAIGLLFFLLIGRYLDSRARGQARSAAGQLLALRARAVRIITPDGTSRTLPPSALQPGMTALVAAGERIAADGRVSSGESEIDTSLIDGETLPKLARPGTAVFAGSLNVAAPLRIAVTAVGEETLLAEITRLVEAAERQRSRHVILADQVARFYTPVVHLAALATFLGWWVVAGVAWQQALLIAIAVLIITCPCALALAVPVVQVIAVGRLLRRGVLVKSGTALERIAACRTIAFDKTGTLTEGRPSLLAAETVPDDVLSRAASLAAVSRHPLARAMVRAAETRGLAVTPAGGAREIAGAGIAWQGPDGEVRLGSRAFCGEPADAGDAPVPELWLAEPRAAPVRFAFADPVRTDAATVVGALQAQGCRTLVLSGDRPAAVAAAASAAGIADWQAALTPDAKVARLQALADGGERVLMVGDGLNDAPALAAAFASASPATAADISQTAADVVFQGAKLAPVAEVIAVAQAAGRLARQNLWLALGYNVITVPLAVAGFVTPLIAAIAMSSSSIIVTVNALRLARRR